MKVRIMLTAGLALALAGCSTSGDGVSLSKSNAVEQRWVGQSAGIFFAKFGPPIADEGSGGSTVYTWRGGYRTRSVAAVTAKGEDGKPGKVVKAARKQFLRCEVKVTVGSDYTIRSIRPVADIPTEGGKTWCEEFLTGS